MDMPVIEALEHLIMLREKEENDTNEKKLDQLIAYESMVLADPSNAGSDGNEFQQQRESHRKRLTTFVGKMAESLGKQDVEELAWPEHVQKAMEEKQKLKEGR
ncbi:hypothetical protein J4760_04035 [Salinicoccus sp. ID82-1]|uniref:hypothetical protein n=1 Tax=Salinicoccus sp. ID82-1 TaxID=2820269 RepID=UPI001F367A73|nr:hypothetical protein [Salinicoccus sp. ID82-1]MCG1009221.1 hypothetical protein [Salinicoccus sp. ID82-1]